MIGTNVFFKHFRYPKQMPSHLVHYSRTKTTWEPLPKGGETHCVVIRDGVRLGIGVAQCGSKDNFCYRDGRLVALAHFVDYHEHCPMCLRSLDGDKIYHTATCKYILAVEGLSKEHRERLHLTC